MPRIQFSDVTPPERRSIRNIPIPNGGKRKVSTIPITIKDSVQKTEPTPFVAPEEAPVSNLSSKISETRDIKNNDAYEYYYPKDKSESKQQDGLFRQSKRKTFVFGTIIVILIAVFVVSMMTVFASATISINPKTERVAVDTKIVGAKNEVMESDVRFEVIKLSELKTVSVEATGEEAVELKASGKIVIYNNFSSEPQRLIVRTRFENPEGLIYRIPESVIVPGKIVKGGVGTPGSVEVEIFADEAGEKYNIKKSDFTIPGFKNDAARFKNFYARSSTDITNGFIGKRKTVAPADKQTALQNIDTEAKINLKKSLETKIPDGLTLLSDSIIYKSRELSQKEETSSVLIGKEVTAYAIMLNKQDLSKKIINEYISNSTDWSNIKPIINDFSLLKIMNTPGDFETSDKINLQIGGQATIVADIDTNIISQRLLGAPKGDARKLMDEFAGILSITATVRPVWKQSFPKNPSKIYVQTTINN